MQLSKVKFASELEANVGRRAVRVGEAIKTHLLSIPPQLSDSEIASELEVHVGRRPVHGGEAIKTHRKVTFKFFSLCFQFFAEIFTFC